MSGRLVLVATPIGNLDDLSARATAMLRDADLVAAEDTRRTGRLLAHIAAETPQVSYHEHNEQRRLPELIERMRGGTTIALVSDAGTPAVSDPGYRLVRAAIDAGIEVASVPGPSAVLHALVVSGLPTDRFAFEGFLPRRGSARRGRLEQLVTETRTVILYASPHRVADDLADLARTLGEDRPAALCRELTKIHEEIRRGPLASLAAGVSTDPPRGEVTLVVGGAPDAPTAVLTSEELAAEVASRERAGLRRKDAIADVASYAGVPKREVYEAVVRAKHQGT